MLIVRRMASGVRAHFGLRVTEWVMLAPMFGIGLVLTFQPDTFAVSPSFMGLARWADEILWGALALLCTLIRLAALGVNGTFSAFPYSPHIRAGAAFVGAVFWGLFASGFTDSAVNDGGAWTGSIAYSTFVSIEMVNVWRASLDVGRHSAAR
ncbi:hypothetical protein ATO13_21916 [Stappia sp. 22II-S9-Z10]|nr:hypothetical protein ATO13_21916 [Stappia sp. 22II-S9-Z10]